MLSEESHRLFVMHDLEGHYPGTHFHHWPQHIILTPLLVPKPGLTRAEVFGCITDTLSSVSPFYIKAGELALYGRNNDIPVIEIEDETGRLREVHSSLIENLGSLGCYFDSLEHSLSRYSPHVKSKPINLLSDQPYLVTSVTIGEKLPKIFHMPKKILKKIEL